MLQPVLGSTGKAVVDDKGEVVRAQVAKSEAGQIIYIERVVPGSPSKKKAPVVLLNVLGSDDKVLTGPDGKPLTTAPVLREGNSVFVDKNGLPIMVRPVLNSAGHQIVFRLSGWSR